MPISLPHSDDCLLFTWFCWYIRAKDATYKLCCGSLEKRRHFNQLVGWLVGCMCVCVHACMRACVRVVENPVADGSKYKHSLCMTRTKIERKKELSTKTIMGLRACDSRNSGQPIENHIWYDLSKSMQLSGPLIVSLLMHIHGIQIRELRWVNLTFNIHMEKFSAFSKMSPWKFDYNMMSIWLRFRSSNSYS